MKNNSTIHKTCKHITKIFKNAKYECYDTKCKRFEVFCFDCLFIFHKKCDRKEIKEYNGYKSKK